MALTFLLETIKTCKERDPTARSSLKVVLCYPGVHAVVWHKLSHTLWTHHLYTVGRLSSHICRRLTGMESDPVAKLARCLVLDHGMGLVFGETAETGDDCRLYHQVAPGVGRTMVAKCHPTVGNNVIIGARAKVLGPISVGDKARIESNATVVIPVAADTSVVGIPARTVDRKAPHRAAAFNPCGMRCNDSLDPVLRYSQSLRFQLAVVEGRIKRLLWEVQLRPHASHETIARQPAEE